MVYCYRYSVLPRSEIPDDQLLACSRLFNGHYGCWRTTLKPVLLSAERLKHDYLFDGNCAVVLAHEGTQLVGHALFCRFDFEPLSETVCWITQLVVDAGHRGNRIASSLLLKALHPGDVVVALVTSHPHAVRALERAARQKCDTSFIEAHGNSLLRACTVPYLRGCALKSDPTAPSEKLCITNTNFDVDHTKVLEWLELEDNWALGSPLGNGEEFVAAICLAAATVTPAHTDEKLCAEILHDLTHGPMVPGGPGQPMGRAPSTPSVLSSAGSDGDDGSKPVDMGLLLGVELSMMSLIPVAGTGTSPPRASTSTSVSSLKARWLPYATPASSHVPRAIRSTVLDFLQTQVMECILRQTTQGPDPSASVRFLLLHRVLELWRPYSEGSSRYVPRRVRQVITAVIEFVC
jgi:hypothetical protein